MKLNELKLEVDYFKFDEKYYQKVNPTPLINPKLVSFNPLACDLINLDYEECKTEDFVNFINGSMILEGSIPYAMAYAGHQFGYFVPQLGDGRAINFGSINNWHLQTKGSGVTRYSRSGDGRAVLRSSIREYIMSEAMSALKIPTTRALGIISSDSFVKRGWEEEPCAIVLRMSPSWIRIGTFEFFARSRDKKTMEQLADYVITQSYPHLENEDRKYEKMFYSLADKTAELMALWQAYGFMHGVMNTDNFSMAGVTIDYGPYAFMDYFEKEAICNHSDEEGRYAYNNQPYIARWNLFALISTLKLICDEEKLESYMKTFIPYYQKIYLDLMNKRLGLDTSKSGNLNLHLVSELLGSLESAKIDYNVFFYRLTHLKSFDDLSSILDIAIFQEPLKNWFESYKKVCDEQKTTFESRFEIMKNINPKYIIKNYMLEEAIEKAQKGDYSLVNDLLRIAQNPFDEHEEFERYAQSTPMKFANIRLSCSS